MAPQATLLQRKAQLQSGGSAGFSPAPHPPNLSMSKRVFSHAGSYDLYSRAGFVQESAFCLHVCIKNYTGYHQAGHFPFVPYPMLLVWCMWFDKQIKPDQPAKPNKQALPSPRVTCLSHQGGVISVEQKGILRATRCRGDR
jgi:hypothetical protein